MDARPAARRTEFEHSIIRARPLSELRRVLCADGETDIHEVVRRVLELIGGLVVMTCHSGPEALKEAEGFTRDLILLDVMMPGKDR